MFIFCGDKKQTEVLEPSVPDLILFLVVFRLVIIPLKTQLQAVSYHGLARVLQQGKMAVSVWKHGWFCFLIYSSNRDSVELQGTQLQTKRYKTPVYILFSAVYKKGEFWIMRQVQKVSTFLFLFLIPHETRQSFLCLFQDSTRMCENHLWGLRSSNSSWQ